MLLMVYGDDGFRVKEKARDFVEKFVGKYDPTRLNVDEILFAKKDELDLAAVAEAIGAAPFLSTKRMLRIDGLFSFATTKPDAEPWMKVLGKIPESTIVMLVDCVGVDKVEKIELAKRLNGIEGSLKYVFPALGGSELRAWVIDRAKERGAVIVPAIADGLIERIGNDSWRLETEIAKLAAYAGDAPIASEMVSTLVGREYDDDMFGFIDAMAAGRPAYALQKLAEERSAGAEDFPLFGMLVRQIRLLLQVRALCDEAPRTGKQDVANRLGIHPFVAQKLLAEVARRSSLALESMHSRAAELDLAMKRGLDPSVAVDRLVAMMLDGNK